MRAFHSWCVPGLFSCMGQAQQHAHVAVPWPLLHVCSAILCSGLLQHLSKAYAPMRFKAPGRTQDPRMEISAEAASDACRFSNCQLSPEMYTTGLCIAAGGFAKQDESARRSQDIPHLPVLGLLPAENGSAAGVFSSKQQQQQQGGRQHKINCSWRRRQQQQHSRQHTAGPLSPRLLLRKHTSNVQLLCRYAQDAGVVPS